MQQQNFQNAIEENVPEDPAGLLLLWYFLVIIYGFVLFPIQFTLLEIGFFPRTRARYQNREWRGNEGSLYISLFLHCIR